jgi:hypothetical protein
MSEARPPSTPAGVAARLARAVMPDRIARLPRDERGYPVPKFVLYVNGKPDFRIMDQRHWVNCVNNRMCWVCGGILGRYFTFVLGPMCIINRTTSEPPCHLECTEYSVVVCPFLAIPNMRRIEAGMPAEAQSAGIMIKRNPGVTALWTTRGYHLFTTKTGPLIQIDDPASVTWHREGREATLAEVAASIQAGMPFLLDAAKGDQNPDAALAELERLIKHAAQYMPRA